METPKTDPNAAAHPVKYPEFVEHNGLTKREYFAALAMQGIWASVKDGNYDNFLVIAKMAVSQADALIDELNLPTDEPGA